MLAGKENKSNSIIFRYFANAVLFATCRASFPFLSLLPFAGPIPPELLFNESRVSAAPRHATLLWPLWFRERKKDGWNKREGSHLDKSRRVARLCERTIDRSIDRSIVIIVHHKGSAVNFRTCRSSMPR